MHFLLSAGSDVVSMKCKADRVDGGYVINGNKMWCTNGPTAQTLVFFVANLLIVLKQISSLFLVNVCHLRKYVSIDNVYY